VTYEAFARNGLILGDMMRPFISESGIKRDIASGALVRLRRGAYVEGAQWRDISARDQHVLRIQAVMALADRRLVAAGPSAAAVWGMPIKGAWPVDVTVIQQWRGGGRSDPGIRRTASGAATARCVSMNGIDVTDLSRTCLDIARVSSFADAIGSVDWSIWRKNPHAISAGDIVEDLERLAPRIGRPHLERLIAFATTLSDSFYESSARAAMHILGFEAPQLQVVLRDNQGVMIPDFLWPRVRRVGEFDGKVKYTRDAYTKGNPSEVVWAEKKREDRLRALDLGVVRILTEHLESPRRLEALLIAAGVPRIR
jgi:hypothetical protein